MGENRVVAKTYVWHGKQCFYVSTIERDCSAAVIPPPRMFETIAWEYDWDNQERGEQVRLSSGSALTITHHIKVCQRLHENGLLAQMYGDMQ